MNLKSEILPTCSYDNIVINQHCYSLFEECVLLFKVAGEVLEWKCGLEVG